MMPVGPEKVHENGHLSDKAYYLAQGAIIEILDHCYAYPSPAWLYRRQDGRISHVHDRQHIVGTEVSPDGEVRGPVMALTEDRKFIFPGKLDDVQNFLLELGLDQNEANNVVGRWSKDNRGAHRDRDSPS